MMREWEEPVIILLLSARVVLAGVFGIAAALSFVIKKDFKESLSAFGFPNGLVLPMAVILPWSEFLVALLLFARTHGVVG